MAHEQPEAGWRRFFVAEASAATGFTPGPIAETVAPTSFSLPSGPPSFDPIDLLVHAPAAAERLRLQRDRCSEKHAAMIPHIELQEAIAKRTGDEQNFQRLQAHPQDGGFGLPPTDARVVAAERQLARSRDDARRAQERSDKLAAAWRAASLPLAGCEDLLKHGLPSGVQLLDYDGPAAAALLLKGEKNVIEARENRGRRAREIKAAIHTIQSSRFPTSYCKQSAREQVELLARRGAVSVSRLVEIDGELEWPLTRQTSEVIAERRSLAFAEVPDTLALIAWLHKDALITAIDREIDAEGDDAGSLSHEERLQRITEAQSDLLDIERQEAALVYAAWEHGLACEHRADCNPVAILGIELRTVPRADTLPETSPGYSWLRK